MNDSDEEARVAHLRELAKRELRSRMRSVRKVLPESAAASRSAAAHAHVLALPELERAKTIVGFCSIHKELDLAPLLSRARELGKQVGLPRVTEGGLDLHRVGDDPDELETGSFGVPEPKATAPRIEPQAVDLVLVPGLAFDARGHRIGYGRAFYDRLLPQLTRAFRVGIAYDFQLVVELPNEAHDIPVHCIISDARCLRV